MNRDIKRQFAVLSIAAVLAMVGGYHVAYAYGTPRHTVNSIDHGCPRDNGCQYGYYGDYFRRAHNYRSWAMSSPWVSIHWASSGSQVSYNLCSSCTYIEATYDKNPNAECDFKSLHVVPSYSGVDLNSHNHWTYEASSSAGC